MRRALCLLIGHRWVRGGPRVEVCIRRPCRGHTWRRLPADHAEFNPAWRL